MRFVQVLAHSFALLAVVQAASLSPRATSSAKQPDDVPYNIDELSQAAGLARKKMYSTRKFTTLFSRSVTRPFCGEVVTET